MSVSAQIERAAALQELESETEFIREQADAEKKKAEEEAKAERTKAQADAVAQPTGELTEWLGRHRLQVYAAEFQMIAGPCAQAPLPAYS